MAGLFAVNRGRKMKGGLRQSMTWLHTWSSITAGWILFAIFLTGTLAFFRAEITYWMQPELHVSNPTETSAQVAYDYLVENAPQANSWQISLPTARSRVTDLSWQIPGEQTERRRGPRAQINAENGDTLTARETAGGNFLYRFHFELYGVPRAVGETLVGIVSMMMLVGLISGIIMHHKIFTDFFMFRPKKKLLSWIDGHAISAVLALPFHLMITFSGLLLLAGVLLPWNSEPFNRDNNRERTGRPQAPIEKNFDSSPPLDQMMQHAQSEWSVPVSSISVANPGTAKVRYTLTGSNRETLSGGRGGNRSITYTAEGKPIADKKGSVAESSSQGIYNYMDMLHQARFADMTTRWVLFLAGILGTIMVGTGSILWAVKRAKQQMGEKGFELIRGLNIGSIAGVCCATGAYFWSNRLLPANMVNRSDWEINTFFIIWAIALVGGLIWRDRKGWLGQCTVAAALFSLIPLLDSLTSSTSLWFAISHQDWLRLSFDGLCLTLALVFWSGVYYLAKSGKKKRVQKTKPVRKSPSTEESLA